MKPMTTPCFISRAVMRTRIHSQSASATILNPIFEEEFGRYYKYSCFIHRLYHVNLHTFSLNNKFPILHHSEKFSNKVALSFAFNLLLKSPFSSSSKDLLGAAILKFELVGTKPDVVFCPDISQETTLWSRCPFYFLQRLVKYTSHDARGGTKTDPGNK